MNERQFRWSVEIFAPERPSVGATLEAPLIWAMFSCHIVPSWLCDNIGRRLDDV